MSYLENHNTERDTRRALKVATRRISNRIASSKLKAERTDSVLNHPGASYNRRWNISWVQVVELAEEERYLVGVLGSLFFFRRANWFQRDSENRTFLGMKK